MAWVYLIVAGLLEIAWSQSIKPTDSFTKPWPTLLCFVLGSAAVYVLTYAMRDLPVGTSYAVFTGIGAVGAIALGLVLYDDPVTAGRFVALGLIVAGVLCARLLAPE
jgi:quaternary ammonium compound-resistance protein SugE